MRRLIVDRFEGKYAICEDSDQKCYGIELQELPSSVSAGDVLDISDDGIITVNEEETRSRKLYLASKRSKS